MSLVALYRQVSVSEQPVSSGQAGWSPDLGPSKQSIIHKDNKNNFLLRRLASEKLAQL